MADTVPEQPVVMALHLIFKLVCKAKDKLAKSEYSVGYKTRRLASRMFVIWLSLPFHSIASSTFLFLHLYLVL